MTTGLSKWWLYGFVLVQLALQIALMIPGLGQGRTVLRAAAFGSSLALLALHGRGGHPLAPLVMIILGIVSLGIVHPSLNTPLAGAATIAFYAAIWGPVFWVGRVAVTPLVLANTIMLLWAFHTLSAGIGVLQVYDPDRFAPDPTFVKESLGPMADGLMVEVVTGEMVYRPFGLTDSPGGAAVSGSFAVLVGLFLILSRGWIWPVLGVGAVAVGMFSIYLSHIRSILIVTAISAVGLIVGLVARGQLGRAAVVAVSAMAIPALVFIWAASIGTGVADRFASLIEDDPGNVYRANRGLFLEDTLEVQLPRFPLGAGPGRHGMINVYFGTTTNPDSLPIWSEIQATAWLFDGGILLLLACYSAVVAAVGMAALLVLRLRDDKLAGLAAVVAAYDFSILVNTFGYSNFLSQGGMLFWVLNAGLYAACKGADRW